MKRLVGMAMMAAAVVAANAEEKLVLDGSTTVGPIAKVFAELYMRQNPGSAITVSESGSGNGAKALLNGTCDIACLSRDLKDTERAAMKEKGVEPVEFTVAYDALSIITHPSNKAGNLTVEQLKDIYTGKITNWKTVGGPDKKIVVISRDSSSGTFDTFKEMVLGKEGRVTPAAEFAGSNGAVRQRVQLTQGAIGYVGLGFVDKSVKAVSVNGVSVDAETVLDKSYPLSRSLYMFTNGRPAAESIAAKYLQLIDTKTGKEAIDELGFIPKK